MSIMLTISHPDRVFHRLLSDFSYLYPITSALSVFCMILHEVRMVWVDIFTSM